MKASTALRLRKLIDDEISLRMNAKTLALANKGVPTYGSSTYFKELYLGTFKNTPQHLADSLAKVALWLDYFHVTINHRDVDDLCDTFISARVNDFVADIKLLVECSGKPLTGCSKWAELVSKLETAIKDD